MRKLPLDPRGYPIPWFVATLENGTQDIRIADSKKRVLAVNQNICWVCGETLGIYKAFPIGPMYAVNRTTSEPPCHLDCAIFSATNCPFLTRPRMKRNPRELPAETNEPAGIFLTRNPGAVCVWVTKSFKPFKVGPTDWLIKMDEPTQVIWYTEGKLATRQQVVDSIDSGLPAIMDIALEEGPEAVDMLVKYRTRVEKYLPKE
jgi:hypothetical protein